MSMTEKIKSLFNALPDAIEVAGENAIIEAEKFGLQLWQMEYNKGSDSFSSFWDSEGISKKDLSTYLEEINARIEEITFDTISEDNIQKAKEIVEEIIQEYVILRVFSGEYDIDEIEEIDKSWFNISQFDEFEYIGTTAFCKKIPYSIGCELADERFEGQNVKAIFFKKLNESLEAAEAVLGKDNILCFIIRNYLVDKGLSNA